TSSVLSHRPRVSVSNAPATTEIYTLSLHDALPISGGRDVGAEFYGPALSSPAPEPGRVRSRDAPGGPGDLSQGPCHDPLLGPPRSEEHTSELQSLTNLVCRLLLEKKKTRISHDSDA